MLTACFDTSKELDQISFGVSILVSSTSIARIYCNDALSYWNVWVENSTNQEVNLNWTVLELGLSPIVVDEEEKMAGYVIDFTSCGVIEGGMYLVRDWHPVLVSDNGYPLVYADFPTIPSRLCIWCNHRLHLNDLKWEDYYFLADGAVFP